MKVKSLIAEDIKRNAALKVKNLIAEDIKRTAAADNALKVKNLIAQDMKRKFGGLSLLAESSETGSQDNTGADATGDKTEESSKEVDLNDSGLPWYLYVLITVGVAAVFFVGFLVVKKVMGKGRSDDDYEAARAVTA